MAEVATKPWYKKWWVIVIAVFVGIGVISAIVNPNDSTLRAGGIEVPDVTDMDGPAAVEQLGELGLRVTSTTAQGDTLAFEDDWTVISQDLEPGTAVKKRVKISLIGEIPPYDGVAFAELIEKAWLKGYAISDWSELEDDGSVSAHIKTITSPEEGVIEVELDKDFSIFDLHPFSKNQQNLIQNDDLKEIILITETQRVSSNSRGPTKTEQGLTEQAARDVCEVIGKAEYPYQFKPRWIVGVYANTVSSKDWFFKTDVKLKNAYGTKYEAIMECRVGGTEQKPEIISFNVY